MSLSYNFAVSSSTVCLMLGRFACTLVYTEFVPWGHPVMIRAARWLHVSSFCRYDSEMNLPHAAIPYNPQDLHMRCTHGGDLKFSCPIFRLGIV